MNAHAQFAQDRQSQASNPAASAWVDANAGTGKTKVLTDRVLKLLLSGSRPDRILCLTFTKAAAAEMSTRLARRLSAWAVASDAFLDADLTDLCGMPPQQKTCAAARQLFARVLDVPGGMRIQTIHAFCQSLLRRFPLEAGISPHFTIMEERDADLLMRETRETVLSGARAQQNPGLAQALGVVTSYVHEERFNDLMVRVTDHRGKLSRLLKDGVASVLERLAVKLCLQPSDTPDTVLREAYSQSLMFSDACYNLAHALQSGGKQDQKASVFLSMWADLSVEDKVTRWDDYRCLFLTKEGTPRARFPSKAVYEVQPGAVALIQHETQQVLSVEERRRSALTLSITSALLTLAQAMMREFSTRKERAGRMDFDDLILTTRHLLEAPAVREWVLFKLDGGVDHVLVDEAQDTSPEQWAIVRALVADFFSGEGQRYQQTRRTIFAVGDRKQSIYSFQGADPDEFEKGRAFFSQKVSEVNAPFADVALEVSFRSTAPILRAVDAVFANPDVAEGVGRLGKPVHHIPFRQGEAGCVEVWPLIMAQRLEDPPAWKPPVERIRGESAPSRLARLMAQRIHTMTSGGERLESRGRPIRPGDILILVRRRSGFVEDLIRALKDLRVPVAGSDRMELTEHLAVMDMMALGHVLLLPEDDLTLACVLKGPILELDEEQLFTLAHGRARGVTLWRALREARDLDPAFSSAYALLRGLMEKADFMPPYELFNYILGPLRGREKILARLGPDAIDPLDELLSLSLTYDRTYAPSLQGFLHWVQTGSQTIQRDFDVNTEDGPGVVRIMTVHGSKGLQAPIVFLPDTTQIPSRLPDLLWESGEGQPMTEPPLVVWSPSSSERDALSMRWIEIERHKMLCEYRRLLYVAMTRAEDRLYVCGWMSRHRPSCDSWYTAIRSALEPIAEVVEEPGFKEEETTESSTILRLACGQEKPPPPSIEVGTRKVVDSLPSFLRVIPVAEPAPSRPLAPSALFDHVEGGESPVRGRGAAKARGRGRLIHSLLQTLPNIDRAQRREVAQNFVARPAWNFDSHEQDEIIQTVLRTLDHAEFAEIFVPSALAEVPISGVIGKTVVSGVIDRLLVEEKRVFIVDFKTTRCPPSSLDEIPLAYIAQMSAYRAVLSRMWPGKSMICGLLWTEGPSLILLPDILLASALPPSLVETEAMDLIGSV